MVALVVTSPEKSSGKTAICAGIGRYLQNAGKKVGYLKPGGNDSDTGFVKTALSLEETLEVLNSAGNVKESYTKVSKNKDVVLIESDYASAADIAKTVGARVLVVQEYSGKKADTKDIKDSLLGVVINKVPRGRIERTRSNNSDALGIISEDRVFLVPTIGEVAQKIKGEVLRGEEQSAELVENVMLGALAIDHGPEYFGRKDNKAVVLRSDRPDMQMAAMETSTKCLVITGDTPLKAVVLDRAEEKNVPIILAKDDSAAVIESIESVLNNGRLHQGVMPRLVELVEQNIDTEKLIKGIGLKISR